MKRIAVLLYGTVTYLFFLGTFLYAIGFLADLVVPKSINSGPVGPLWTAVLINALLLGLFAVQHTVMARPAFKRAITRLIPQAAERSTFVLLTNLVLCLLYWQWQPMTGIVWQVDSTAFVMILNLLFWTGWGVVLISTFLIDHFELFGLKQAILYSLGRPFQPARFTERSLYKIVRHPIMLGFLIAFWARPSMTVGHLFFSVMTTGYILVGLAFEERDLIAAHGEKYLDYARRVPRLVPFLPKNRPSQGPTEKREAEVNV